jgi:sporulation protein YlmC with PRC-barrel domain
MKTHTTSLLVSSVAASLLLAAAPVIAADAPGTGSARTDHAQATGQASDTRSQKAADKAWEQAHRASKIIGTEVQNAKGEKVGTVKDLVLDNPSSGQVTRVVVSVGGVSGRGDKLFALPYSDFQRNDAKNVLVLNSDSDLAHAFDSNDWQALANQGENDSANAPSTTAPAYGTTGTASSGTASSGTASSGTASSGTASNGTASTRASEGASAGSTAAPAQQ